MTERIISYLYRNLHYEEYQKGETIFTYNDIGDLFYIVMQGEVIVKTPAPHVIEEVNRTPENVLYYLIKFYKDIYWAKMTNGPII